MKNLITGAVAALTLASTAMIAPAEARPNGYGNGYGYSQNYRYDNRRNRNGDVAAAGIIGLAVGALIGSAASRPSYGYAPAPAYGYYGPPQPRYCRASERVWDPYIGRYVYVDRSYRC